MTEEVLFEFLHSQIVDYTTERNKVNRVTGVIFLKERNWRENLLQENDLSALEYIGFTTGTRIIERLTRDWPRFKDELDTMKFICTDFWSMLYKKQIDNLRTNHQGIYVLQDNGFRFLTRFSNSSQFLEHAPKYVAFTCGLIRGSLANLGINSNVTAEVHTMPSVKFHIQVNRNW